MLNSEKLRAELKTFTWALTALLSLVALWFAANRLLDESPVPDREQFLVFASDQLPDERNIAIGILGLTAPSGQDFVQHGAKVKSLVRANAPRSEVQEMVWGPKTLQPTKESEEFWRCWQFPSRLEIKDCIPFEQASAILMQNSELLAQYKAFHRLGAYSGYASTRNHAYLTVVDLAVAELHLDLKRNQHDGAYRKWRDQVLLLTSLRSAEANRPTAQRAPRGAPSSSAPCAARYPPHAAQIPALPDQSPR